MLFHTSEQSGIECFDPRPSIGFDESVVWAVNAERLRNYLLPRDCPRVTFFAGPNTLPADTDRFLGASPAVVAFETAWLDRVRSTRLFCYHLPEEGFECVDENAGYFVSRKSVVPSNVEIIDDLLEGLVSRDVEIRIVPSLWPLHDAVIESSLCYSMIRMRNASPRRALSPH